MITEATTTEDLIATLSNAPPLSEEVSFEEGCAVLDTIELFDRRTGSGKRGTWVEYNRAGRNALRFIPEGDPQAHPLVCEKLTRDIFTWMNRQFDRAAILPGDLFTAWVVIDRATRVTWVECSPIKDTRAHAQAQHPRSLRGAGEFPSSALGTVSAYVFLRLGEPWDQVQDSTLDAYQAAKDLLDQYQDLDLESEARHKTQGDQDVARGAYEEAKDLLDEGCAHKCDQDAAAARKLLLAKGDETTVPPVVGAQEAK